MAILNVLDYGAIGDNSADDTLAIQNCLADAGYADSVYIPIGTYRVRATLRIKSGTIIEGEDEHLSKLTLAYGYALEWFDFREPIGRISPIIVTEDNSQDIFIKNLSLDGHKSQLVTGEWGVAGIFIQKTKNVRLHNVHVDWINLYENLRTPSYGFNIISKDADNVEYYRCSAEYAGYQPFGFFDRTTNSKMHECTSGMGLRTSVQVHRDCDNIQIFKNVIVQPENPDHLSEPHGAITLHGEVGEEVRRVTVEDNDVELAGGWKAAIQAFRASVDATIINNRIKSNGEGIHLGGAVGAVVENNKIESLPQVRELQLGHYGISVIGSTRDSFVRYNEIFGFDVAIYKDSTIDDSVIIFGNVDSAEPEPTNPNEDTEIRQVKLYVNQNGEIVEVEVVGLVDGVVRKSESFIKY